MGITTSGTFSKVANDYSIFGTSIPGWICENTSTKRSYRIKKKLIQKSLGPVHKGGCKTKNQLFRVDPPKVSSFFFIDGLPKNPNIFIYITHFSECVHMPPEVFWAGVLKSFEKQARLGIAKGQIYYLRVTL